MYSLTLFTAVGIRTASLAQRAVDCATGAIRRILAKINKEEESVRYDSIKHSFLNKEKTRDNAQPGLQLQQDFNMAELGHLHAHAFQRFYGIV